MENLWAPWRLEYIKSADRINEDGCIFCDLPSDKAEKDRENLIVFRSQETYVILNKYPYNGGHLLVVPYQHTNSLDDLSQSEKIELMQLLQKSVNALQAAFGPHGYNIGMNLGRTAGAGIEGHLHFHVVPRWRGDTNFMPVVGQTKVISAGCDETWEKLRPHFED